ncbi:hypothetical protein POP12_154 [Pectobacterium phage POP12]|nr:hypothetical protein POP12_154 [Pectobacterium phage POP12]
MNNCEIANHCLEILNGVLTVEMLMKDKSLHSLVDDGYVQFSFVSPLKNCDRILVLSSKGIDLLMDVQRSVLYLQH